MQCQIFFNVVKNSKFSVVKFTYVQISENFKQSNKKLYIYSYVDNDNIIINIANRHMIKNNYTTY